MRHIIPISGKDSLATALIQRAIAPDLEYEYVFNPTGFELPEVIQWIDKVEKYLGKKILKVGADLGEIIKIKHNYFLPSQNSRYCTMQAKIEPFVNWVGKDNVMVYYGIRADEKRQGFNNKSNLNILPIYPLIEHGIGLNNVYNIINKAELKPPAFFGQKCTKWLKLN